jgi:dipeptidyl aminopeptidase/acylaminoacyl peptidase
MKTTLLVRKYIVLFLLFVLPGAGYSQQKILTPEIILTIKTVVDAQLSPDAKNIIFQVNRPRTEQEKPGPAISELWTISTAGGEPRRFTFNDKSDRSPAWSPDGKWIAFLSQRGESNINQIYLIPFDGGEAIQLTKAETSVQGFKWSPDGSRIAYTMTDPKSKDEQQAEKEGRDWTVFDKNYKHTRVYVVHVASKESKLVSHSPMTVHDFDWSSDGKQLVIAAAPTPSVDDSFMKKQLYRVPADGGESAALVRTVGKIDQPRWSPDGKWIAWLGATVEKDPYAGSVFVAPATGGSMENLTRGYSGTAIWIGWQPGKPATLVVAAIERQSTKLYTINLVEKKLQPIAAPDLIYVGGPSFSRDGKLMVLIANAPTHPNEIFFGTIGDKNLKRLTRLNPQLADVQLGEQEEIKWKSVDGWEIEGVLVKPVGYRKGQRYPVVMQPHGGPEAADLNGWYGTYSRWGQMLAGRGYAVFYPNYRGSIGRGPDFAMADHRDLMGKEFEDMVAGIDHLINAGIADRDRIGVGGGSYGGYTSAWAATYGSERFKAAIMWMGISNWISMTGTSDIFYENSTVHWNLMMYEDNNYDLYWRRSPLAHIKTANTPTLIIHGAADPRVPPSQSQEMYTALRWKGVPVEYVSYPREGHGVAERAHQYDFMNRVITWFDSYLQGKKVTP